MKFSQTKTIIIIAAALSILLCFTSCKTNKNDAPETKSESVEEKPDTETVTDTQPVQAAEKSTDEAPAANQDARNAPEDSQAKPLPEYQYPGDDPIPKAISDYLTHEIAKNFAPADIAIPSFSIVGTDALNPDDTLVWGDFWIFNYKLENDTLLTESGGSFPGLMHLKKSDDGYTITKMDVVADGADNLKSAKEIFADKYDDFHKINSNRDEREKIRLQFISDYVKANKLSITKVKDSGWNPVLLP